MLTIITRYLTWEILKSSTITILVLFVILISNALGRVLSDIADGDIPQQALLPVLISQSVNMFSLLLPVGFFLGIILAFGRLYKDHEVTVMNACGMSGWYFYRPVCMALIPLLVCSIYTSFWLNAEMQRYAQNIIAQEKNIYTFDQVKAGQFHQDKKSGHAFYIESIDDDRLVLNNIIISQNDTTQSVIETAQQGRYQVDETSGDLFLVIGSGKRYEGIPGEHNFTITDFQQHGILIERKVKRQEQGLNVEQKTPEQLWKSQNLKDWVELHWRISIPIMMVILSILAVPLSYIAPRQGQFGKVGYAFLAYLFYFNLMVFSRSQIEIGMIPSVINFWWVHAVFIVLTLFLLIKRV